MDTNEVQTGTWGVREGVVSVQRDRGEDWLLTCGDWGGGGSHVSSVSEVGTQLCKDSRADSETWLTCREKEEIRLFSNARPVSLEFFMKLPSVFI